MTLAPALRAGRMRLGWSLRRIGRGVMQRVGATGLLVLACAAVAVAAAYYQRHSERRLATLAERQSEVRARPAPRAAVAGRDEAAQFAEFQRLLMAPEEIPTVVQDLIALAQREGLRMSRGEYKAQRELQGGYMRYQMTMPVRGSASAVHAFLLAALKDYRSLALETVQFRREQILANQVEARIQWSLLTKLPKRAGTAAAEARP